jgi:RNA polymerase sigma-70 factor (ECF subfamily)
MGDSCAEWVARLQTGDDAAAHELFERFAKRLITLARRRLADGFKPKLDAEDVVQSAYKSFFHRYGEGGLKVADWDSLWGLLTVITLRKCADRVAYYRAECRDAGREASTPPGSEGPAWPEPFGREPTPLEAAELSETVARLFAVLDENERPVLELSLEGYSTREISERLGRAERTVRLLRECARLRLERMRDEV